MLAVLGWPASLSPLAAQMYDLRFGGLASHYFIDPLGPAMKRASLLVEVVVFIVNAANPALVMRQQAFDDVWRNA